MALKLPASMSTLIFLPGLAADADLWAAQTRALPHDLRWAISLVHFRHRSIETMAAAVLQRLQHLTETLNQGIALKRRIVEDLHPSSLSNLGLLPSLEILIREFSERSDLTLDTRLESVELDESSQLTLYRLVQEALTNIGKYARAQQVSVRLQNTGTHALLTVSDDGIGFNPEQIGSGSHGLEGMRHRVEAAGGRLVVESSPGQGSRIMAYLPTHLGPT